MRSNTSLDLSRDFTQAVEVVLKRVNWNHAIITMQVLKRVNWNHAIITMQFLKYVITIRLTMPVPL
jgi:hypothetical protein